MRLPLSALILALLLVPAAAEARQWKPSTRVEAQEYLWITHRRTPKETVHLLWVTPQLMARNQISSEQRRALERYILLAVIDAMVKTRVSSDYEAIPTLTVRTAAGTVLRPVDRADMPATAAAHLHLFEQLSTHEMGDLGRGANWFVFDAPEVKSCGKGGFVVPYRGEEYAYETPLSVC